jgi:DNA-binding PadR family transcriptional regulator
MRNKEVVMTTKREKKAESAKLYRNSEKGRATTKRYLEENKDAVRASGRKANAVWRKKNPEKVSEYNAKYNDAKRIENAYNEWNDTLYELGYGDLV